MKTKIVKLSINVLLLILFSSNGISQTNVEMGANDYEDFLNYSGWGFFVTPVFYKKAVISKTMGDIDIVTIPKTGFQIGTIRYFTRTKKWSFNTGIALSWIPSPDFSYDITDEIPVGYTYSYSEIFSDKLNGIYMTIPLRIEFKQRLANKIYINFSAGLNLNFGTGISSFYLNNMYKEEQGEVVKVNIFNMFVSAYDSGIQFSSSISSGFYFTFDNWLLQTNIVYNKNFQNLWSGEYKFSNSLNLGKTTGVYEMSGDYVGFSTTVFFKNK